MLTEFDCSDIHSMTDGDGPKFESLVVGNFSANHRSLPTELLLQLLVPNMQISSTIAANYSSAVQVLTVQLLVFINVPMGL